MASFLDQYEPLDIIGNGSFGIIRKVRRKADGMVFARKELNFERMTERDRKQIVAEVNILKELHNEHIVRYHNRYVDRDAGILYIVMEYCGGGDLSTVIKQAEKTNRPIPEDTIWSYFMQILLALNYCHHPNGHGRGVNGGSGAGIVDEAGNALGSGPGVKERRAQILHRDLKPDNVFLDENNVVKLGDFGLSKALPQSSFACTYVGTPYYMSPELMQEKAYDSKSDIWSLGCLIYELCALKPPFHEAKTHSELSMCIRNGRIPPLPRGYSQSLSAVIKAMLNLNPAMRPSATQLLQHERLELSFRVSETDKLLSQVKSHRTAVLAKEREVLAREEALKEKEHRITSSLTEKDAEILRLHAHITHVQQRSQFTQRDVELAVKQAISRREEELRVLIQHREKEVASAMAKREEEIMEAVRRREDEVCQAWFAREVEIRQEVEVSIKAVQERVEWIQRREEELKAEEEKIEEMGKEVEERMKFLDAPQRAGKLSKVPLEEVKNLLEPIPRATFETTTQKRRQQTKNTTATTTNDSLLPYNPQVTPKPSDTRKNFAAIQTPIMRPNYTDTLPSAMKGVVLTATGETLATPSPTELAKLFNQSPKVGLGFTDIFESDSAQAKSDLGNGSKERRLSSASVESDANSPPPSPSARKEKEWKEKERGKDRAESWDAASSTSSGSGSSTATIRRSSTSGGSSSTAATRLRKPSIRSSSQRPTTRQATSSNTTSGPSSSKAVASSAPLAPSSVSTSTSSLSRATSSLKRQNSSPSLGQQQEATSNKRILVHLSAVMKGLPAPVYDLADEENLPSPFLKKVDKVGKIFGKAASTSAPISGTTVRVKKRPSTSGGNFLRVVAAANVANGKRASSALGMSPPVSRATAKEGEDVGGETARPALLSARKATEEAKKVLLRS